MTCANYGFYVATCVTYDQQHFGEIINKFSTRSSTACALKCLEQTR